MSVIVLAVLLYAGLYVLLSVPSFQEKVKDRVCRETSAFLGGNLTIDDLKVKPFSELSLSGVSLFSPDGERCAYIGKVAAGIDLWCLFAERRVVLNYAELIGLDANVIQYEEGGDLNIGFIIDALSPKDRSKPPTLFDLRFRNIIVRRSKASFTRQWMLLQADNRSNFADVRLDNLRLDLSIPVLKNDMFRFDIRNMRFDMDPGVSVAGLSADISYLKDADVQRPDSVLIRDFHIDLPHSSIAVGDLDLALDAGALTEAEIYGNVTPSDFSSLIPQLSVFSDPWRIVVEGKKNGDILSVKNLDLSNEETASYLRLQADASGIGKKDSLNVIVHSLSSSFASSFIEKLTVFLPNANADDKLKESIVSVGDISVDLQGRIVQADGMIDASGNLSTEHGTLDFDGVVSDLKSKRPSVKASLEGEEIDLGRLLDNSGIGRVSFTADADLYGFDKNVEGNLVFKSNLLEIGDVSLSDVDIRADKKKDALSLEFHSSDGEMNLNVDADCVLAGAQSLLNASIDVDKFNPSRFGVRGKLVDTDISGRFFAHTIGDNPDNISGNIRLSRLRLESADSRSLSLSDFILNITQLKEANPEKDNLSRRALSLRSDWIDADIKGDVNPTSLAKEIKEMASTVFPALIEQSNEWKDHAGGVNDFEFYVNVKGVDDLYDFFKAPVRPLSDIPISGFVDTRHGKLKAELSTPYLQQGKNKLIRDVALDFSVDSFSEIARMSAGAILPAKKGDAEIKADLYGLNDKLRADVAVNPTLHSSIKGGVALEASFSKIPSPFNPKGTIAAHVDILPSIFNVNETVWTVGNGKIDYSGKRISVSDFQISHEAQYVKIDGTASDSPSDAVTVKLNDIDLDFIFGLLNINYVTFGGMATGEVTGRKLLTKSLEARTHFLRVKDLSYNGAVLGDGELASEYEAGSQKVGIFAVIRDPLTRERRASVDGGIWVTRDSLSFNFDAYKVNLQFMKPFVSAFCSDLKGAGSGKCKLYGSFSDIDLIGSLRADTLSMKLDFTNTWYHAGGDSVFLHSGMIEIPPLTLYDDRGHTAELSGWLRHTYFHEPVFSFRVRDAKNLLCYDTNEMINPLWYGTIYGSGNVQINGDPGLIDIDVNMTTEEDSRFYYVISEAEDTDGYQFLTFTDRRKAKIESEIVESTVPAYLTRFMKKQENMAESSANVKLSIKGTVNNDALVTIVMDPKAGDNITAIGKGALQMYYNMANNDLRMIGTYIIDEGNYNFTLQDIIIRNFNIRQGSSIKFDGDPMNATLDINATYRVNTNLTDLDKSFSTDRELNRTNVPVDAVLLVDGPMTHPDVSFDLELPTLTSDVGRKVKSIVSTNDMMSRQIIYLLALNRFYTPEYTGGSSNGSEWSSVASSTISSQLSNMLSQLTDKLDVAPSFRSDNGHFTDVEFDLALSSRLLNNRLLINGNFGYRDRNTSNTQFVGDFDIEYLLSKNGNLRLKAYNHFNDQNYYLRSALTTQGVGVVFRKDFDSLFRHKKKDEKEGELPADSLKASEALRPEIFNEMDSTNNQKNNI